MTSSDVKPEDNSIPESRFKSGPEWLAWRLDCSRGQQEILAMEQEQRSTAEAVAATFFCSVQEEKKFGDRLAVGYLVLDSRAARGFWIWGANRPMSKTEVEAYLRQQIEAKIFAEC